MHRKFATALAVATLLAVAPLLSACYATRGAGEDLQSAGKGLSHAADQNTHYTP